MLQDRSDEPVTQPPRRVPFGRIRLAAIVVLVVLIAAGFYAIHRAAQDYVVFAPGSAPLITSEETCRGSSELVLPNGDPCALLQVPSSLSSSLSGKLFMVDVSVYDPATSIQYVESKLGLLSHLHNGSQLVPVDEYTGGQSSTQTACSGVAEMSGAQEAAPVAALTRLGYTVKQTDNGVIIGAVVPGSPAASAGLCANETITAINGRAVRTASDLVAAIRAHKAGDKIRVTTSTGAPKGNTTVSVTLATTPPAAAAQVHEPVSTPFLGIEGFTTNVTYTLPFNVSINAGDIGGPSAGLAFTLGIIDLLSGGKLTGGAKVAATGEMDPNGTVEPIGGVAQKTVAVERAGATVFLVPAGQNYQDAQKAADRHLKVEPVSNLDQALADLAALGGTIPPTDYASSHPYRPSSGASA
jgi:PDZ domain-containing protein